MHTFDTPRPVTLTVRTGAGQVSVAAQDTATATVTLTPLDSAAADLVAETTVTQDGDSISVLVPKRHGLFRGSPRIGIEVAVPTGSSLVVHAESADVHARGRYADAELTAGSGDLAVEAVTGSARLKSGSGTVTAGQVEDALVVGTGSGDVNVDHSARTTTINVGSGDISIGRLTGETTTKSGSGDVEVGVLEGALVTKSGSGDLTVRRATAGSVHANGASGTIDIGVGEGTATWLDLSTLSGRKITDIDSKEPVPEAVKEKCNARVKDWLSNRKGTQIHLSNIDLFRDEKHRRYFVAEDKEGTVCGIAVLAQVAPQRG